MAGFSLPKTYDFRSVEERLYDWWERSGYFKPRFEGDRAPFVISIPPPNVTGELHLGHAMFIAVEDLFIRYHRMKGEPSLWVPGTDHAGIATQLQVEKALQAEGLTREGVGRAEFERRVWAWKEKYGGIITRQLRRLGASCDWDRERFTLDDGLSRAVREAFVRLYEDELIYRGTYLINWSPGLQTAVSDLEVEYSEEQGTLYFFRYPIAGSNESIPVATTRPETILGDTAVAVHPEDERYRKYIGRTCRVPILDRPIPVIADEYVDREFGTGALKITPGHDQADYDIGQRHGLAIVSILNPDATLNENAGPYAGLDRYACRERLWSDMAAAGLTIRTEPYTMQVPRSQRGGEAVEPMISTQWFVHMKPIAEPALEAVRDGRVRIVPERFAKVYANWLENIRDWCISRQLWWGHRIPAWHCADCGKITVTREDPTRCAHCGSGRIEQDPDVLDTWFSSGLWPFSTLGWPEKTWDLETFYPTSVMETGYDILFFWVARMIMMGLKFTGKAPFHTVYLHGIVRDKFGRRMSKSLGTGIDPLWILDGAPVEELPDYAREQYPEGLPAMGTDALRFTLLTGSTPGKDLNLNLEHVEANRNFANKLWNAARLVLSAIDRADAAPSAPPAPTLADRWILSRRAWLVAEVERLFDAYQFGEAGRQIYEFFWGEFADWYLEIAKLQMEESPLRAWGTARTMADVLDTCLRLLHPFTPYITEELWGHLRAACWSGRSGYAPSGGWEQALIVARWPVADAAARDPVAEETFGVVVELIRAIRNVRAEKGVEPKRKIAAIVSAGPRASLLVAQREILIGLARLDPNRLEIHDTLMRVPPESIPLVSGNVEAYLPLAGLIDAAAERERITKGLDEVTSQIRRLEALLAGEFSKKAPPEVVERERAKLAGFEESRRKLEGQLGALG